MAIPVASRAIYLRCEFKFGVWSGDVAPTSYYPAVNFTKLEIQSQIQEFERLLSNMESNYGQVLRAVPKPTESATLSAEANYMPPYLFGLLLGADITELAQTTSAVVKEAIVLTSRMWMPLANRYIAAHGTGTEIVAYNAANAEVTQAGNIEIDLINGLIRSISATGDTVTQLSYHPATRSGEIYKGGQAKSAYLKLVGTGTEKTTAKRCRLVIHKASLAASAAFDPTAGSYINGSFAGTLLTPTGETSPWQYEYLDLDE